MDEKKAISEEFKRFLGTEQAAKLVTR